MNVLMIGNSYTYYNDMPRLLESLLRENGYEAEVSSVTRGGRKLIACVTTEDECTRELDALIQGRSFDLVFLQDQSLISILDPEHFEKGVTGLAEKLAPHAKAFVLYATWGRMDGSPDLALHHLTRLSMTEQISAAYQRAAALIGAKISPVGAAFAALCGKMDLYAPDLSHPSYAGSCLAAIVHYATITGRAPEKFAALNLDPAAAAQMAETAARLCSGSNSVSSPSL